MISSSTVLFIDPTVSNYQSLIQNLSSGTDVIVLDPHLNGIEQITQTLQHYKDLDSLQILSHGAAGTLYIGNAPVTNVVLEQEQSSISSWADALAKDASILLYGCEVAAGQQGEAFIQRLAQLAEAEVAASTNLTGCFELGGDWDLEASTGAIHATSVFDPAALEAYEHVLVDLVLEEDFRGSTVLGPWIAGSTVGDQANRFRQPFLTARDGRDDFPPGPPTNLIKGSPVGPLDPVGQGAFRFTGRSGGNIGPLNTQQSTFLIYNLGLPFNAGLDVTFNFYAYGSDTFDGGQLTGADGLAFFLIDGNASPTVSGSFGGSLGYAQRFDIPDDPNNPDDGGDGLVGGYLGIGFDEFGNFAFERDIAGGALIRDGGSGDRRPDSVSLRGPGNQRQGYAFITHRSLSEFGPGFSIDNAAAQTRDQAVRTARVRLLPNGRLTVTLDMNGRDNPGQEFTVIDIPNIAVATGQPVPSTFKFGFASATGTFTNIHEINTLEIRQAVRPPVVSDVPVTVPSPDPVALTGANALVAVDPDGLPIVNYIIRTLPNQGQLFLGDPGAGGTVISSLPAGGRVLTPDEAARLFYVPPSTGFTGSRFEYTATDADGATDQSNGIVALIPLGNQRPIANPATIQAEPGETVRVTGISAVDPDPGDGIDFFTITSLPAPDQGVLVIDPDNPRLVIQGERLTQTQLDQLFFRARAGFSGTGFTYTATDRRGAPSIPVTFTVEPGSDGVCEPGLTILGTNGDDNLTGGPDIDTIRGFQGNDTIRGLGCGDLIFGNEGNDNLSGDNGSDTIRGGQGNDLIFGNRGEDILLGNLGNDRLEGGQGNDLLEGGEGNDVLLGQDGDDRLFGLLGNDLLQGGAGNDVMFGGEGDDIIEGEDGNDLIRGEAGNDTIRGGDGNDNARGNRGSDTLFGGNGDDVLRGGFGDDVIYGGAGNDRLLGRDDNDQLFGGAGDDFLLGYFGNDFLVGGQGNDLIFGEDQNDVLEGGEGNDELDGGTGDDRILGNPGNDRLFGREGNDVLLGGQGNDLIFGGFGDDDLYGNLGQDELTGGQGADRFFFDGKTRTALASNSSVFAPDRVVDFKFEEGDRFLVEIDVRRALISGLFNAGTVQGANLTAATIAAYANKNQATAAADALQANEAVFFRWLGGTYLSINDRNAPFSASTDLVANVTGISFRPGDANAGVLAVSNYFVV